METEILGHVFDPALFTTNPIILDLGATDADFAVSVLKHCRGGLVYAYEPNSLAVAEARKRINTAKLRGRVFVFEAAISDHDGSATFHQFDGRKRVSSSLLDRPGAVLHKSVKAVDIASVISSLPFVDLLKIDIEGTEGAVIQRIVDAGLSPKVGQIAMELHEEFDKRNSVSVMSNTLRCAGWKELRVFKEHKRPEIWARK